MAPPSDPRVPSSAAPFIVHVRSRHAFLGLPLFELKTGTILNGVYHRGVARAWIAIGDVAFGPLLSIGGIAFGGIAIGGLALGALAVGGLAVGPFAVGGVAVGVWAVGGAAFAVRTAIGGFALSGQYAAGGLAIAPKGGDALSTELVRQNAPLRLPTSPATWVLFALPFVLMAYLLSRPRDEVIEPR